MARALLLSKGIVGPKNISKNVLIPNGFQRQGPSANDDGYLTTSAPEVLAAQ